MKEPKQEQIIEEFAIFDDWLDKYNYLIELSADLPLIASEHRTDNYIIKGCQSRVWVDSSIDKQGCMHFTADSDAIITKGIIALLIRVMDGMTPQEVLESELYFIDKIGLGENLSPTRANGLVAMIHQMKLYAMAFNAQKQ
ncbi:MAG: SufE family protein [Mucinivorans sp.]